MTVSPRCSARGSTPAPPRRPRAARASAAWGLRDSTGSAPMLARLASPVERSRLALPQRASARASSAESPWRASTPIRAFSFTAAPRLRLRLVLPPPGLEQVLLGELRRLDPDHRVAELLAHAREHLRVL